jgi:hypothetical protein
MDLNMNKINSAFERGNRSKQRGKRGYSSAAAPGMARAPLQPGLQLPRPRNKSPNAAAAVNAGRPVSRAGRHHGCPHYFVAGCSRIHSWNRYCFSLRSAIE